MKLFLLFFGGVFFAFSTTPCHPQRPGTENADFQELLDEAWEFRLRENPLFATSVGDRRFDDRLPHVDEDSQSRRNDRRKGFLQRLQQMSRNQLNRQNQVNYDLFRAQLQEAISSFEFRTYRMPVNADSGFHISFARLPSRMVLKTTRDYENYLSRLRVFDFYMDQHIALMREGLKSGHTIPRVTLEGFEKTIESQIVQDPEQSAFYGPLRSFPPGVPEAEHARLRREARTAVVEDVIPSYERFLKFMVDEYMPGSRSSVGASDLPNGDAYYRFLVRRYTTLNLTPEQVHETGLREVARIRAEMEKIIEEVGFEGSFSEFLDFLRTSPQFYAETPDALLKESAYIAKRMDGKLPSLFGRLPRLPYGIQPVPADLAPKYTGGRYISAPWGGTEAGNYWINTYNLKSRPLYVLEALTLHEAVPGHHLQIALARELEELPLFRRFYSVTAFSEGWALYSERLGLEAGFYTDPYSNFGRLTYEMWRACRLVVDTGVHAKHWTRDQVGDFLASNTALSLHEIGTETDRYISTPGQALAYKIGELKIRELRKEAEDRLGTRFDIRDFHDVILLDGPIPLPLLEEKVQEYINATLRDE